MQTADKSGAEYTRHWNDVYATKAEDQLGWYQAEANESMELIQACQPKPDDTIIDIGTGLSPLIKNLYDAGFRNIVATDISETALQKHREKLGEEIASAITWITDDITQSVLPGKKIQADIWHDRAVFHFLTDPEDQQAYLRTLDAVLKPGGHAIIGTFSLQGAKKCSSLDVVNYDAQDLDYFLGDHFVLEQYRFVLHHTPSGAERPFTYTVFRKTR